MKIAMKAALIAALGLIAASPGWAQDVGPTQQAPRPVGELTLNCRLIPAGAAAVVVTGNVKTPGIYPVQASGTSTVLTAIAQAQGWGPYISPKAWIYRNDEQGQRHEIEIDLQAIRKRGNPDVILQAKDILYLPENSTAKNVDTAIQAMTGACLPADRNDSKFEAPDPR
jgi:protein involved in polysaccharide export with SLBB domain